MALLYAYININNIIDYFTKIIKNSYGILLIIILYNDDVWMLIIMTRIMTAIAIIIKKKRGYLNIWRDNIRVVSRVASAKAPAG